MISKDKHQKHAKLQRPALGNFARNEFCILGTTCTNIKTLAKAVIGGLSDQFKLAYVDADHKSENEETPAEKSFLDLGAHLEYTDKIGYHRFDLKSKMETYQYRIHFNEQDLVLVNGNHFLASKQIVVVDPKKFESLGRKLDRLTNVRLVLLTDRSLVIPDFLKEYVPVDCPILQLQDTEKITDLIKEDLQKSIPPIHALILAGGKSQRMGKDKGALVYHGKSQREHVCKMANEFCEQVFLSCREDQVGTIEIDFPLLTDRFIGLGPFGAILSAFQSNPDVAWLVLACDLPLLDKTTLEQLIKGRNASKVATSFVSPVNDFPEPLVSIWEPRSYPLALQFLAQGYACPRKVLINTDVNLLEARNPKSLMNVNDPDEYEKALLALKDMK